MTSKKKRFGGGSTLVKGIVDTVRANSDKGEAFNVEMLALERINPDPKNPRLLGLTEGELLWLNNDKLIEKASTEEGTIDGRTKSLLKLRDMADSIISNGVLQPIRVYRVGDSFRIESGERRYWGSIIAKETKIPAIILKEKPKRLRTFQLIENLQRDDLNLSARLRNIASVIVELEAEEGAEALTSVGLGDVIGTSRRQASKYLAIIRGQKEVMSAITSGALDNLDMAVQFAKIEDVNDLNKALALFAKGEVLAINNTAEKVLPVVKKQAKGRPVIKINLGNTKNQKVVKHIMEKCGFKDDVETDWGDLSSTSKKWLAFLAKLEKEL